MTNRAFIKRDTTGQHYVIGEGSADEMQMSGRWISTQDPVKVEP